MGEVLHRVQVAITSRPSPDVMTEELMNMKQGASAMSPQEASVMVVRRLATGPSHPEEPERQVRLNNAQCRCRTLISASQLLWSLLSTQVAFNHPFLLALRSTTISDNSIYLAYRPPSQEDVSFTPLSSYLSLNPDVDRVNLVIVCAPSLRVVLKPFRS